MHITGSATVHAPVEQVWSGVLDPAVLARTIPGCERLETVGVDHYRGTIQVGVAAISGAFDGEVKLEDKQEPATLTLRASGSGSPGTVQADVAVHLAEDTPGQTTVTYDATAVVGGMIGGVGQRVLVGVAKRTAEEFFRALDAELTEAQPAVTVPEQATAPSTESVPGGSARVQSFPGRVATRGGSQDGFVAGALFGAAVALAGVLVGAVVARRR
ncbi:carbon monoxide dehydrogenase subunit G [Lipingzhangella sp. LS1_29]|uniref:Carbon monoxide dehydrogenase subunit G n=1 Tax=Lipingzhangella rawalii TaxID=2055835 RepID=A0ABU2HBV6_9ACTN|nr:carbon monoxide dehydrogenase subunit G [Lipingzhangella rawalii]MDS1272477.1 carbon monoxide dehydrogenase subunit G [Lipingzhangella rawalii]